MSDTISAIVVMGVSGCGKSTVAAAICARTGAKLIEGDDFHPVQNIQKMRAGIPLTDADRQDWLARLAKELVDQLSVTAHIVLTCSALKRRYRDVLRHAAPNLGFVFLDLTVAEATERVSHRQGHFMPASLVESQFHDLEPPHDEALVLTVPATSPVDVIVEEVICWWAASTNPIHKT